MQQSAAAAFAAAGNMGLNSMLLSAAVLWFKSSSVGQASSAAQGQLLYQFHIVECLCTTLLSQLSHGLIQYIASTHQASASSRPA
jgi:hypothetical protein